MRCRLSILLALALSASAVFAPSASAAIVFAQAEPEEGTEVENDGGNQADPGTDTNIGGDSSQGTDDLGEGGEGEADAETGAGEGEQAPAAEEEGPQWTYQMSKITLAMLLLLFLAMGALYYRMIARRQRGV